MLSKATVIELRAELETIERRAQALRLLLSEQTTFPADFAVQSIHQEPTRRRRKLISAYSVKPGDEVRSDKRTGTLADFVRAALRELDRPCSSREVTELIKSRGDFPSTKRDLSQAVSVELFRLAKSGSGGVKKLERGVYAIAG